MKPETIHIIRQTVPILEQHGEVLVDCFYKNMFRNNPEVKAFFNPAHQQSGTQQRALAGAICAYARYVDTPEVLKDAVELIAQKHVALGIKPEHYPIVGNNLLLTLREVLGEAATDEVINAWAEAYGVLADVFINREDALYHQQKQTHGWEGFKDFRLVKRQKESSNITSFYLSPVDNKPLQAYLPGQYLTLKVTLADGSQVMRNYSLSAAPREDYYRISVKQESNADDEQADGVVSSHLHANFKEGDSILVGPPNGVFTLKLPESETKPVVFIAGGVGITPLLAMLQCGLAQDSQRPFTLIQLCKNSDVLPFYDELSTLASNHPNFQWHVRFSQPSSDCLSRISSSSQGRLDNDLLDASSPDPQADYYVCGPVAMMQATMRLLKDRGVNEQSIFAEFFGPAQSTTT